MPADCSLFLEVYEDDRTTVAWTVTTDPAGPLPYLIDPMRYGEQQIDVAKGSATIGTVTAGVIDPATIAGDQDSGWMTARLAQLAGRRCRLRRYIDVTTGYVVIADGPAGEPKLEPDYASYLWEIRDTRETERKVRAFLDTEPTTSAWPIGIVDGWGTIAAVVANTGEVATFFPSVKRIIFPTYFSAWPTNPNGSTVANSAVIIAPGLFELGLPTHIEDIGGGNSRSTYGNITLMWRLAGAGTYTVVRAPTLDHIQIADQAEPFFLTTSAKLADGTPVTAARAVGFSALANGTDIDVIVLVHRPASKAFPVHVEGLTAGEFAQNMYDGVYSPRDAFGALVPSGIRYDAAALALMTTPVSLRLFEPITDARDWLEKYLYPADGWCPALDSQGRISPVSQIGPEDDTGLTVINNAIAEPRPSWGSGSRIINLLRFVYPRDYLPDPAYRVEKTGDGLAERRVELEFRDETSITRHGEHVLEIDGRAFRAIGTSAGEPIDNDITAEIGYQLAQLRNIHVKGRYVNGARSFALSVMRSGAPTERAGSYVAIDLPWLPDPDTTGRRGLEGIGQVMSIADLDCAWREMSIEMLPPPPAPPSAIGDLAATAITYQQIDLTWTLPAGATGVRLYRSTTTGFTPAPGNLIATLGLVEEYEDMSGLTGSTTYYYKAIALNDVGDAAVSNQATATTPATPAPPPDITVVPADAGNTASTQDVSITMPVAGLAAGDEIRVYRDGVLALTVARTAGAGAAQTVQVTELDPSTAYVWKAKLRNVAGIESANYSPTVSLTTDPGTIPTPTVSLGAYNIVNQGMNATITPGASTPAGVTWHIEHNIDGGGFSGDETGLSTTAFHSHGQPPTSHTCRVKAWGTKTLWTASAHSVQSNGVLVPGEGI